MHQVTPTSATSQQKAVLKLEDIDTATPPESKQSSVRGIEVHADRRDGSGAVSSTEEKGEEGGEDVDEEVEIPEDLAHLPPEVQQRRIIMRSCYMMAVGSILVLVR